MFRHLDSHFDRPTMFYGACQEHLPRGAKKKMKLMKECNVFHLLFQWNFSRKSQFQVADMSGDGM